MSSRRVDRVVRRSLLWGAAAVLGVVLFFVVRGAWDVYEKLNVALAERHHAEDDLYRLRERKAGLEHSLAALTTTRGVEGEIRTRFPLVKPGEEEFILIDAENIASSAPTRVTKPWWGIIFDYFW